LILGGITMAEEIELTYQEQREIYNREKKDKVEAAIEVIMREINCMGSERDVGVAIRDKVLKDHPTLQQRFFADVLVPIIEGYAGNKCIDARNEASHNVAKRLMVLLKDEYFPFI
jgi:hypothetical protein